MDGEALEPWSIGYAVRCIARHVQYVDSINCVVRRSGLRPLILIYDALRKDNNWIGAQQILRYTRGLVIVWVAGFTTKCMIGSRVGVANDWARDGGWITFLYWKL